MGRGTSKVGGGSGGSSGGTTGKTNSVSGKPFDANDWKTWTPGTKVEFNMGDDLVMGEDRGGRSSGSWVSGTVKSIHKDHIIVDVPTVSDHMWLEDFNAKQYRVKKSKRG